MARNESVVHQMEDAINDLLAVIGEYGDAMRQEVESRPERDPVAKLASFQVTRVGWLEDLCEQMEEIVRDMLDRVQQVEIAEVGRFTGQPDDAVGQR